jgi:hypothetical protein
VGNLTALHWVDLTDFTCNIVFCGVDSEPTFVCKKKKTHFMVGSEKWGVLGY